MREIDSQTVGVGPKRWVAWMVPRRRCCSDRSGLRPVPSRWGARIRGVRRPEGARGPIVGPLTVIFTDVERSTELYTARGDDVAGGVMDAHAAIVNELTTRHGGWQIKSLGDGFLLAFASVARRIGVCDRHPAGDRRGVPGAPRAGGASAHRHQHRRGHPDRRRRRRAGRHRRRPHHGLCRAGRDPRLPGGQGSDRHRAGRHLRAPWPGRTQGLPRALAAARREVAGHGRRPPDPDGRPPNHALAAGELVRGTRRRCCARALRFSTPVGSSRCAGRVALARAGWHDTSPMRSPNDTTTESSGSTSAPCAIRRTSPALWPPSSGSTRWSATHFWLGSSRCSPCASNWSCSITASTWPKQWRLWSSPSGSRPIGSTSC